MLSHEKLDVYRRSIEFLACALKTAEKLPRGEAPLADQLRRAAMSIPLNIAEGSGRTPASADAILDRARLLAAISEAEWDQAKALLVRVVEMLSKMS